MSLCAEEQIITETCENMHKGKRYLLDFIALFRGNESDEYRDAASLVYTSQDIHRWIELFDGDCDNIAETNRKFRLCCS